MRSSIIGFFIVFLAQKEVVFYPEPKISRGVVYSRFFVLKNWVYFDFQFEEDRLIKTCYKKKKMYLSHFYGPQT